MMHFTDASGLLGNALVLAAIVSKLPGLSRLERSARGTLMSAVLVFAFVPLGELPLAAYLRGVFGDLSMASLLLLGLYLVRFTGGGAPLPLAAGRHALLILLAATAVVFYPMALGWGSFDPYRLGYGSYGLLACLLPIAIWGALRGHVLVAAPIALAVAAWSAGWYDSTNLWDYLLDPLVSVYAIGALVRQGVRRLRGRPVLQ